MMQGQNAGAVRAGTRALLIAVAAMSLAAVAPASAAEGGGCRLTATAAFSPALTISDGGHAYSLSGTLSMCYGMEGTPASATVSFGNVWTDSSGHKWQEPVGTSAGSCFSTTTSAISIVRWEDGTVSVIELDTTSATFGVNVDGTVLESVTLTAVDKQDGQADTLTVQTTRLAGGVQRGFLFAMPADGGISCGGGGLATVPLDGPVIAGTAA